MAKIIDLGWAKPDDPIYSSGPMISFRPPSPGSMRDTATSTDGASRAAKSGQPQKQAQPQTTSATAQQDPMQPAAEAYERQARELAMAAGKKTP